MRAEDKACGVVAVVVGMMVFVVASDPELTTDFAVPAGVSANGDFFTFTELRDFKAPAGHFALKKATSAEFPALTGLGISMAVLDYRPKTLNPPHTHPRGTEILYLIHGTLHVGLIDSSNKLYEQVLHEGDVFVFPKGLVHFQINRSGHKTAKALAAFSSSAAGTVSLPTTLFASGIDSIVLEKAFQLTAEEVAVLEASLKL